MSVIQSSASLQYVVATPIARTDGSNITNDSVEMAFLKYGDTPEDIDFHTAVWLTGTAPFEAGILVAGPDVPNPPNDTVVLDPGVYAVWLRVTDDPEIPVELVDRLILKGPLTRRAHTTSCLVTR